MKRDTKHHVCAALSFAMALFVVLFVVSAIKYASCNVEGSELYNANGFVPVVGVYDDLDMKARNISKGYNGGAFFIGQFKTGGQALAMRFDFSAAGSRSVQALRAGNFTCYVELYDELKLRGVSNKGVLFSERMGKASIAITLLGDVISLIPQSSGVIVRCQGKYSEIFKFTFPIEPQSPLT